MLLIAVLVPLEKLVTLRVLVEDRRRVVSYLVASLLLVQRDFYWVFDTHGLLSTSVMSCSPATIVLLLIR